MTEFARPAKKAKRAGHAPFSAENQPQGAGRKRKDTPKGDGKWDARLVLREARDGVEASDIATTLGLQARLQADPEVRAKFEELVEKGHALHRRDLAKMTKRQAEKGKANALKEADKAWLARYSEDQLSDTDEAGLIERGLELIRQIKKRRRENAAVEAPPSATPTAL